MAEEIIKKKAKKEAKVDVKEVLTKYLVYSPFIILCLAISLFIVYMQLRYAVPTYTSSINVLIKDIKKTSSLSDQVLGELSPSSGRSRIDIVNQTEVLKSTTLMQRVVEALDLNLVQKKVGNIKTTEIYKDNAVQLIFDTIYNATVPFNFLISFKSPQEYYVGEKKEGKTYTSGHQFTNETGKFRILINFPASVSTDFKYLFQYNSAWNTAGGLAKGISVNSGTKSNIVYINTVTEDPRKGRDILNQLVVEYNNANVEDQNKIVDNSIAFIDERLQLLTNELGTVEEKMADFSQKNEAVGMEERTTFEFGEANNYQKLIQDNTLQLQLLDMIREYVNKADKKYDLVPSNLGITDMTFTSMIQQYNQEILKRSELLKTVPESNPSVGVLNGQIEQLRNNIQEALNNLKKSFENTNKFNKARYDAAVANLGTIPGKQLAFREISRQQGIKEQLYLYLLQQREQSAITKASTIGGSQPIDPAISGGLPASPDRSGMYKMAFLLGLGIPIGLIYLKDFLNNRIITRQQIATATDCPLLGEISHDKNKERRFVVANNNRSMLAEQYRILRTNVQFLLGNKSNSVLMVTSSVAGEGKTFNSMNLAAVLALSGKKTVMVEMDLRKPKISSSLSLGNVQGITHYIMGQATLQEIAVPLEEVPGLYIVPAGIIPPNPAELILDPKIKELLNYLKANFDMVIIDMAPVGLVSDARIIGQYADATVFIVRQRFTLRRQLEMIDEMYENKVLPNMGIVTNDVKIKGTDSYYGYYGYGYGYGNGYTYNYNYNSTEAKKGLAGFFGKIKK